MEYIELYFLVAGSMHGIIARLVIRWLDTIIDTVKQTVAGLEGHRLVGESVSAIHI